MEITSIITTAAATKSPKAALSSLPEVINFYHTGKGSYLGKFVWFLYHLNGKKTERLYPSAPFEKNIDLEQRLEKN